MSEKEPLERLAQEMLDHMASLRKLVINQQETLAGIAAMNSHCFACSREHDRGCLHWQTSSKHLKRIYRLKH